MRSWTARWFETYRLTTLDPPIALTQRLADVLRGEEVQAALHELLAARLTDAPEADAASARQVLSLTLLAAFCCCLHRGSPLPLYGQQRSTIIQPPYCCVYCGFWYSRNASRARKRRTNYSRLPQ